MLIFAILTLSNDVRIKPRTVFVEDVLGSSNFAGEVVITGYDDKGDVHFKSTTFNDTLSWANLGNPFKSGHTFDTTNKDWTLNLPYIGDTVFIVTEGDGISLFGKRVGNDYRLWSPLPTGSIAIFVFTEPLKGIDLRSMEKYGSNESCWDGCLLPIHLTKSLILEYRQKFKNKLAAVHLANLIEQPTTSVFYNDTVRYYNDLVWKQGAHKKLISFTLTYSTGQALEINPVNNRNKSIRFDTTKKMNWDKFNKLKIKKIRWRD